MKLLWINPVGTSLFDAPIQEFLEKAKAEGTELHTVSLSRGPSHLEYHYYEALVLADTLHEVRRAEVEGYDAAVIGCFYDPGLMEAREITERLVVTAPAEAAMPAPTTPAPGPSSLRARACSWWGGTPAKKPGIAARWTTCCRSTKDSASNRTAAGWSWSTAYTTWKNPNASRATAGSILGSREKATVLPSRR